VEVDVVVDVDVDVDVDLDLDLDLDLDQSAMLTGRSRPGAGPGRVVVPRSGPRVAPGRRMT